MKKKKNLLIIVLLVSALITSFTLVSALAAENLFIHHIESMVNDDGNSYSVEILLSVLDAQHLPIPDLTVEDFQVSEDDVQIELETAEMVKDLPINVILVMDVSGSMQGQRLQSAKSAISQFIKSLYRGDKIAIYTFHSELTEIVSMTEDLNSARDQFETAQIYAGGGTCLFDATYAAAQMASDLPPGRQAIVILSDGWDTVNGSDTCSEYTAEDIIEFATGQDFYIPIYTIGIGTDLDRDSLIEIANQTGATFTESSVNTDLPIMFEQLANRLSSQYKLTYQSQGDPGLHSLSIKFKDTLVIKEFSLSGLPPLISIAYPEEGQILESGINTIKLSLSERGIPIDSIAFQINGISIGVGGKVGQPPYEYDIDFSQYDGEVVDLTILALDKSGETVSETTTQMNLTGKAIEANSSDNETGENISTDSCPEGSVCVGNLQLTRDQIIIIGGIFLAIVLAVVVIIFFSKKRGDSNKQHNKESLFEDLTLDEISLPSHHLGQLTILSSDDPLVIGKEFQLAKSPTTIGRSVNNDIVLPKDSAVSRQHVKIFEKSGQIILSEIMKTLHDGTHQPPTYGTYVNDHKVIGDTQLHTGDEISLGRRTKLRFEGTEKSDPKSQSDDVTRDEIRLSEFNEVDDATQDV